MAFLQTYLKSEEFKNTSRKTSDSAMKLIFNWGAWAVIGFFNFIGSMFKMILGKH